MVAFSHRLAMLDWKRIAAELDQDGCAVLPGLFDHGQAGAMAALIGAEAVQNPMPGLCESGGGEVLRLTQNLPEPMNALRTALYAQLLPIANRWNEILGIEGRFPPTFDAFRAQNGKAGQARPQSSLSRLRGPAYQALHQYAEGRWIFPLQLVALLSEPERDFTGGELVMIEQRPRMQSRSMVLPLGMGDAAIIAVAQRPFKGGKGFYRVNARHAISRVRSGERIGLELVFHDAP
ncbi:2OG-Fe(II) oxygenase [Pollutimonas sp. H1-120]|uniref:2OG-Fe(II) oxygenase n=1 Tax=Pollutimonas sp. H1-120 TaxID=3148824 RepID=UPI003B529FE6